MHRKDHSQSIFVHLNWFNVSVKFYDGMAFMYHFVVGMSILPCILYKVVQLNIFDSILTDNLPNITISLIV